MRREKAALLLCVLGNLAFARGAGAADVNEALRRSGFRGGVVVHLGCADGRRIAALHAGGSSVVQGLDTSADAVGAARELLLARGLYGRVTAEAFDGTSLPYVEGMVNLLVVDRPFAVTRDEMMRVLAPGGVLCTRDGGAWRVETKPRPPGLDEWTHYLHDPEGTMVGKDAVVGPPKRVQWVGGPKWLRNHEFVSSMHAMVSSGGRIFYVMDEGLRKHIFLPPRWVLIARDAFNGVILWKRKLPSWHAHNWPMKSGPGHLPRRLVAVGDRVYVTLGIDSPVSVLDAGTGETVRTCAETKTTQEIVLAGGVLYLLTDPAFEPLEYREEITSWGQAKNRANTKFGWTRERAKRTVMAVEAASGKVLWRHRANVAPLTLTVGGDRVFFYNGVSVVALERAIGREAWVSEDLKSPVAPATGYAARMAFSDGIVLLCNRANVKALAAGDGKLLWTGKLMRTGHNSPNDMFVMNGLVWSASTGKVQKGGTEYRALDLRSGEVKRSYTAKNLDVYFMHQRCYPGRATERYIITSGTGTEFHEIGTDACEIHHYVRGSCIYGVMPANGLLYKPPDSCACHYQSKLTDFCALAPAGDGRSRPPQVPQMKEEDRLERGPAYGAPLPPGGDPAAGDWPAYRADAERSGHVATEVRADVEQRWVADIGGRLSAVTVAGGRAFVAAVDRHALYCLDAATGEVVWEYLAGGRIDSPPTLFRGSAIFGCADGRVYRLRASDGMLTWRYLVAPGVRQLVSYGRLESLWPVHGSVLLHEGVLHCLAGRNMFFDGGLRLVRLDPATGRLLSETVMNETDPTTGRSLQARMPGKAMPVANADILSCDGRYVYLRAQKLDLEGKRVDLDIKAKKEADQAGEGRHLFCPTGFLDDSWFHRSYMIYGKNAGEGHGEYTTPPSRTTVGRLMVFDESTVYSFRAVNYANTMHPRVGHVMFAAAKELGPAPAAGGDAGAGLGGKEGKRKEKKRKKSKGPPINYRWRLEKPGMLANAMTLAGKTLFIAGPPDVADETGMFGFLPGADDEVNRELLAQEEAWRGKLGAVLRAVSAADGSTLAEHRLEAIPVWDGMAAAGGKLFISLGNGKVVCWE